ncbi:probable protein phosphatase 2C 8 [Hibiscus syriacus]|uniref:probable protein phosphatase 2C 8 n=1 Tax=Hibiscus syriacus TaxID=106335 RepID=UPI0019232E89|nr:probable protein phosphatase 2C 8 [Hibiscus syriacus]
MEEKMLITSDSDGDEYKNLLNGSSKQSIVLADFGEKTCGESNDVPTSTLASHGVVSVTGRRREMEDAVKVGLGLTVKGGGKFDFYGVYDENGRSRVAEESKLRLHKLLVEEIVVEGNGIDCGRTMNKCFEKIDEEVSRGRLGEETVGPTAVVAVVGGEKLVVANCRDSIAVFLTRQSDQYLQPFVICKPEVIERALVNDDEFLVLASDGLRRLNRKSTSIVDRNRNHDAGAATVLVEL